MKKNRMMRLASGLLVAVLVTTSMISGTFAKYTTQDSASDVARVAKWGVELQVVGNLYGDTYKELIIDENKENADFTVQSIDAFKASEEIEDVVAPGTKNVEGFTFSLKGQPEVDGEVNTTMIIQNVFLEANKYGVMIPIEDGVVTEDNFDEFTVEKYDSKSQKFKEVAGLYYVNGADYSFTDKWLKGKTYCTLEDTVVLENKYYPVEYTLTSDHATTSYNKNGKGHEENTLSIIADKIAGQLGLTAGEAATDTSVTYTVTNGKAKKFESNTELASWLLDGVSLTWAWDFEQYDSETEGDEAQMYDKADTILGMLISYREKADLSTDNLEGTVVKLDDETYKAPTAYTDYCLDTQFSIDITVTQVD